MMDDGNTVPSPPARKSAIGRLIAEAGEFAAIARRDGFDVADAIDLIEQFAQLTMPRGTSWGEIAELADFADRMQAEATACCTDPDAGPECQTSVSFTGTDGARLSTTLHRLIDASATGPSAERLLLDVQLYADRQAEDHEANKGGVDFAAGHESGAAYAFRRVEAHVKSLIDRQGGRRPVPAASPDTHEEPLTPEGYVTAFIAHGEVNRTPLPAWEQPYQDAGMIERARQLGYLEIGRDVACTITLTEAGRKAASAAPLADSTRHGEAS